MTSSRRCVSRRPQHSLCRLVFESNAEAERTSDLVGHPDRINGCNRRLGAAIEKMIIWGQCLTSLAIDLTLRYRGKSRHAPLASTVTKNAGAQENDTARPLIGHWLIEVCQSSTGKRFTCSAFGRAIFDAAFLYSSHTSPRLLAANTLLRAKCVARALQPSNDSNNPAGAEHDSRPPRTARGMPSCCCCC